MNRNLPFSEIMKLLRRASRESDFNAAQIMLMERDKNTKIEIENLTGELNSLKKEVALLKKSNLAAESEKSKAEEKLQKARSKFEDMREAINQLKNQNSEYEEKLKCRDAKIAGMEKEIEYLRGEKLESEKMVEELRRKNLEKDKVVEELKKQNDELRRKNAELDKDVVPNIEKLRQKIDELWKYRESSGDINLIQLLTKERRSNRAKGSGPSDGHANKMAPSSAPVDIIEIVEDDDETNPNAAASITERVVASNAVQKETILDKSDQNPPSGPTKKRSRTDSEADHLVNTTTRRGERSIRERKSTNLPSGLSIDEGSTDSDDDSTGSCSSSHMNNLIAKIRSKRARQKV